MDYLVFALIYVVVCILTMFPAVRIPIEGDRESEYIIYREAIVGKYHFRNKKGWREHTWYEVLDSCFIPIILPAYLYRILRVNAKRLFQMFPSFFYALMPAFAYLIARNYLDVWGSLLATSVILTSFYFLYEPNIGRIGIGLGFAAGMVWSLLANNWAGTIIFAVCLVLSHYGTTYVMLYVLGITWFILVVTGQPIFIWTVALVSLGMSSVVWHHIIIARAGKNLRTFLKEIFLLRSATLRSPVSCAIIAGDKVEKVSRFRGFFKLSHRECTLQHAFGKNLKSTNIPQKIEWVLSWIIVLSVTLGLAVGHTPITIAFYSAILLAMVIPHLSVFYGSIRVFFSSLIVLAPCFVIGVKTVFGNYWVGLIILILYGLAVSGVLHRMMGINKRNVYNIDYRGRFRRTGCFTVV